MPDANKLVIVISRGFDDERSSVGWVIANTAVASGAELTVFLVSSGVDWVRKGAANIAHLNPRDPTLHTMISNVIEGGARVMVCPPCAAVRGYGEESFIDGVMLAGAPALLEQIFAGSNTLSF